jgi:uncharacterized membrane protein (UPF0127 family)
VEEGKRSRKIKYIVEMTVRAGVQEHSWAYIDFIAAARPLVARARKILPYVVALLIIGAAILFAVSCNGSTVAFSNNSTVETLSIEVAKTPEERTRGLMERESLPEDGGMLFDFGGAVNSAFWMKDTSFPLSIAFVDSSGRITSIMDLEPFDETPVKPADEYRYAIEANRGWFSEHGIEEGFMVSIDL